MHVEAQAALPLPTKLQVEATQNKYQHTCEFCGKKFKTARGRNIHRASCGSRHDLSPEEFEIKQINAVFGTPQHRWFRVEWVDHPGKDSWEPERSLVRQGCEPSIKDFWRCSTISPATDFIADPDDIWWCWLDV